MLTTIITIPRLNQITKSETLYPRLNQNSQTRGHEPSANQNHIQKYPINHHNDNINKYNPPPPPPKPRWWWQPAVETQQTKRNLEII